MPVNAKKITFVDSGVLIAAFRGNERVSGDLLYHENRRQFDSTIDDNSFDGAGCSHVKRITPP